MIGTLIRLDPAMKSLRASVPLALAAGLFIGALVSKNVGWFEEGLLGVDTGWFVFVFSHVWLVLLLFMILSHITARCAHLSLTLPLPTRKLWLARIISINTAGLLPLAALTTTLSISPLIFEGGAVPDAEALRLGALMGLGLILTSMLYQSPSPDFSSIRGGWRYLSYVIAVSCGIPALLLLGPRSIAMGLALLAASAILGVRIYLSLPVALSLAPRRASESEGHDRPQVRQASAAGDSAAARSASDEPIPFRRGAGTLLHLTTFRVLVNHPLTWVVLPIAAFYGYSMARSYYRGADLQLFFMISLIWLVALLFQGIIRMHKLDSLPISRKLLFAHSILPVVLVMVLGAGAGQIHFMLRQNQFKMIRFYCRGGECDEFRIRVPDDCLEIAWDGTPPAVISPGGESHVPRALPLYSGSNIAVYNPYEVTEISSDEFIEFQLTRAIERIHGVPAPSYRATPAQGPDEELRDPARRGEVAVQWPENRGSKMRNRTMATRVLLLALFTAAIVSIGLQQFRATRAEHVYPWLFQGLAAPIMVALGGVYLADKTGHASLRAVAAFPEILIRKLGESIPLSTPAIWGLAIFAMVVGYRLILHRFGKIEAPIHRSKKLSEY